MIYYCTVKQITFLLTYKTPGFRLTFIRVFRNFPSTGLISFCNWTLFHNESYLDSLNGSNAIKYSGFDVDTESFLVHK